MHELPYESPREGAGDSRRLARWLAAGSLAIFLPCGAWRIQGAYNSVIYWDGTIDAYTMQYLIGPLTVFMSATVIIVWCVSGRVPAILLAGASASFCLQATATFIHLWTAYGWEWDFLEDAAWCFGGGLLVWLFLTPAFRRAVNAPRTTRG